VLLQYWTTDLRLFAGKGFLDLQDFRAVRFMFRETLTFNKQILLAATLVNEN
jgi:hypothetical protein